MLAQACLKLVTLLLHPECEDNRHTLLYRRLLNFSLKRLRKLAMPVTDIPSLTSKPFSFLHLPSLWLPFEGPLKGGSLVALCCGFWFLPLGRVWSSLCISSPSLLLASGPLQEHAVICFLLHWRWTFGPVTHLQKSFLWMCFHSSWAHTHTSMWCWIVLFDVVIDSFTH